MGDVPSRGAGHQRRRSRERLGVRDGQHDRLGPQGRALRALDLDQAGLDAAHHVIQADVHARVSECLGGRVVVQTTEWRRGVADIAGGRRVEQPGAEHLRSQRQRRVLGFEVQCRGRDDAPQRVDAALALAVAAQELAEGPLVEAAIVGIESTQGQRRLPEPGPVPEAEVAVAQQRRAEVRGGGHAR